MSELQIDSTLLKCVIQGTGEGVSMTGLEPSPVGASRFLHVAHELSALVSFQGPSTGSMILNMSRSTACFMAGRLLGTEFERLDEETVDAVSEIGNMVAGRFKDLLRGTEWEIETISLPAVVLGASYSVYHSRGIVTASVDFELAEISLLEPEQRFFTCAISRMRR